MEAFDRETYRELLASEQLDPDQTLLVLERIAAILKIGFATICGGLSEQEIDPEDFEPERAAARGNSAGVRDVNVCGQNQAAMLFEMEFGATR